MISYKLRRIFDEKYPSRFLVEVKANPDTIQGKIEQVLDADWDAVSIMAIPSPSGCGFHTHYACRVDQQGAGQ